MTLSPPSFDPSVPPASVPDVPCSLTKVPCAPFVILEIDEGARIFACFVVLDSDPRFDGAVVSRMNDTFGVLRTNA